MVERQREQGGTFTRQFDTAGTFAYTCTLHAGMTGTVVVQQAGASARLPVVNDAHAHGICTNTGVGTCLALAAEERAET